MRILNDHNGQIDGKVLLNQDDISILLTALLKLPANGPVRQVANQLIAVNNALSDRKTKA